MEIRDDRKEALDIKFKTHKNGQPFLCPEQYDEDEVFIKIGFNNTDTELTDEEDGWYAVLIKTGEFLYFYNDDPVIPINAMVVIND